MHLGLLHRPIAHHSSLTDGTLQSEKVDSPAGTHRRQSQQPSLLHQNLQPAAKSRLFLQVLCSLRQRFSLPFHGSVMVLEILLACPLFKTRPCPHAHNRLCYLEGLKPWHYCSDHWNSNV